MVFTKAKKKKEFKEETTDSLAFQACSRIKHTKISF